jgi:hypothetical protein
MNQLEREIKHYLECGVYCPREIFNRIYPTFTGHYSVLRDTIAKVKDKGI